MSRPKRLIIQSLLTQYECAAWLVLRGTPAQRQIGLEAFGRLGYETRPTDAQLGVALDRATKFVTRCIETEMILESEKCLD